MASETDAPALTFDDIPGTLPKGQVPDGFDLDTAAPLALRLINNLHKEDVAEEICWRDLLSLTDTYRTIYGQESVLDGIERLSSLKKRSAFREDQAYKPRLVKLGPIAWIDVDVLFDTQEDSLNGRCAGIVSITQIQGEWKIWMIRTWLECFDGHGHPDRSDHIDGVPTSTETDHGLETPLGAMIIGGGQAGLSTAGRLQSLGVPYMLFEKLPEIGGIWASRYESLRWHTAVEYGNLPFGRTFLPDDDVMLPARRIAEGHKAWATRFGIKARTGTEIAAASWDGETQIWTVRSHGPCGTEEWKARNLVLAIGGNVSVPIYPEWASPERITASGYQGTIMHSLHYKNSGPWAGKRGVVVGVANTGFDIAEDMANAGMHTTMIQRRHTFVLPVEWLLGAQSLNYNLTKNTTEADRLECTYPLSIARRMTNAGIHKAVEANPERFDALEQAGFKLDRYGDIFKNIYIRAGGHYVDIGGAKRVSDGEIKVNTRAVRSLTPSGLLFEDNSELDADLIVLCTGFSHDFRSAAEKIVGHEVASQMDRYYGLNTDGEISGYGRLAGHPSLFYFGGDTRNARFYSKFIALQVQKQLLGGSLKPHS